MRLEGAGQVLGINHNIDSFSFQFRIRSKDFKRVSAPGMPRLIAACADVHIETEEANSKEEYQPDSETSCF